jgi:hypothetical protein
MDGWSRKIMGICHASTTMHRLQLPKFNVELNIAKVIEMTTTERLYPEQVKEVLQLVGRG